MAPDLLRDGIVERVARSPSLWISSKSGACSEMSVRQATDLESEDMDDGPAIEVRSGVTQALAMLEAQWPSKLVRRCKPPIVLRRNVVHGKVCGLVQRRVKKQQNQANVH